MRGFSKAIITGNLTRDPELRSTSTGSSVCSFGVAVNRVYRGADGENKEEVSFFDCSAWGRIGETIAQYAKKGNPVLVSGRLSQRSWEDKTGNKRYNVEIVVEDFNFLGGGRAENSGEGGQGGYAPVQSVSVSAPAPAPVPAASVPEDIPDEVNLDEVPF